jgi:hypothetical protein
MCVASIILPSRPSTGGAASWGHGRPGGQTPARLGAGKRRDEKTDGRRLQGRTVWDEYTRESVAIHCVRSIIAGDVGHVLQGLWAQRDTPGYAKSDNGPELLRTE